MAPGESTQAQKRKRQAEVPASGRGQIPALRQRCSSCGVTFESSTSWDRHLSKSAACRKAESEQLRHQASAAKRVKVTRLEMNISQARAAFSSSSSQQDVPTLQTEDTDEQGGDNRGFDFVIPARVVDEHHIRVRIETLGQSRC